VRVRLIKSKLIMAVPSLLAEEEEEEEEEALIPRTLLPHRWEKWEMSSAPRPSPPPPPTLAPPLEVRLPLDRRGEDVPEGRRKPWLEGIKCLLAHLINRLLLRPILLAAASLCDLLIMLLQVRR
jgi:hypothetical protein